MLQEQLPLSCQSIELTKALIFQEEWEEGWRLYGKLGGGDSVSALEYGWFVGWIEKGNLFFPFAYLTCDPKIQYRQIIPKVKQLIQNVLHIH